jgi:spermidine synthase
MKRQNIPALTLSFSAGFVLMGYEMLASRAIAPVFGSSIVTWMAIISFVLVGISVGNAVGAKISKHSVDGARNAFVWAFGFVSPLVLLCYLLAANVATVLASSSLIAGSLIFALFFVGIPSVFLGIVSPLLVRISVQHIEESGFIAGRLSVSNIIGSVLGIFLVTLVGIPGIGVRWSTFALSLTAWVSWTGWIFLGDKEEFSRLRASITTISLVLIVALLLFFLSFPRKSDQVVAVANTLYYNVAVTDATLPDGPIRALVLDGDSHSLRGKVLPADYYVHIASIFHDWKPEAKNILALGGGAYTMPELLVGQFPDAYISVYELDRRVTTIVKKYFGISEKIKTVHGDARVLLSRDSEKYDILFGDVYQGYISVPWQFMTREFFTLAKSRLNEGGMFGFSFISTDDPAGERYLGSVRRTFASVFPCNIEFAFKAPGSNTVAFNRVFVGFDEASSCDANSRRNQINDWQLREFALGPITINSDAEIWTDDKTQSDLALIPLSKKFLPIRNNWLQFLGVK